MALALVLGVHRLEQEPLPGLEHVALGERFGLVGVLVLALVLAFGGALAFAAHMREKQRGRDPPRSANTWAQTPALLKGLIFGPTGAAMSPTHTRKGNRLYRYYVSQDVLKRGPDACPVGRVPAAEIEAAVIDQLRGIFRQPEIIVGTWRAARAEADDITEDEAREALTELDPLWDELFPAEQARIVQLLVERVDVRMNGVEVRLRPNGIAGLVREVAGSRRAAA